MSEVDEDQSSEGGVKSRAVIKHSVVQTPVQYHELQVNFDLNQQPPNWLYLQSQWERIIYDFSLRKRHSYTR